MILKIGCSLLLAACLIWLYNDRNSQPLIAVGISSLALIYAMFNKKSPETPTSGTTFNMKSGKNSINTQSTGTINVNVKKDAK